MRLYDVLVEGRKNRGGIKWENVYLCLSVKSMLMYILCACLNERRLWFIDLIKSSDSVEEVLMRVGVPLYGSYAISNEVYDFYYYVFYQIRYNCLTVDHLMRMREWISKIKFDDLMFDKWRYEAREGVYCWIGSRTRKFYIGRTNNIKVRMQQHINNVLKYVEKMDGKLLYRMEDLSEEKKEMKDYFVYKKVAECGVEDFCFLFLAYDNERITNSMEKLLISYYNPSLNTVHRVDNLSTIRKNR